MIDPLSVAVEGIGFGPLAMASLGFLGISIIITPPQVSQGGGGAPVFIPGQITIVINWDGVQYRNTYQHKLIDNIINIIIKLKQGIRVLINTFKKNKSPTISVVLREQK